MDSDGLGHGLPLFTLKNTLSLGPQSLRARLIALLLASVLAGQIATLYLVSQYQRNHAQTVALDLIATTIRALHFSMEHAAPADRAEFVRQASEGQWRLWTRPLPNDVRLLRRPTPASTPLSSSGVIVVNSPPSKRFMSRARGERGSSSMTPEVAEDMSGAPEDEGDIVAAEAE